MFHHRSTGPRRLLSTSLTAVSRNFTCPRTLRGPVRAVASALGAMQLTGPRLWAGHGAIGLVGRGPIQRVDLIGRGSAAGPIRTMETSPAPGPLRVEGKLGSEDPRGPATSSTSTWQTVKPLLEFARPHHPLSEASSLRPRRAGILRRSSTSPRGRSGFSSASTAVRGSCRSFS